MLVYHESHATCPLGYARVDSAGRAYASDLIWGLPAAKGNSISGAMKVPGKQKVNTMKHIDYG